MKVLGIESTCDETAAAVISGSVSAGVETLSSIVASQVAIHQPFGGVFPEIAAREHLRAILPTIKLALQNAKLTELPGELDAIAIANRPGLIGGLMIGAMTAKTMAEVLDLPLVAVDHVYAHIYGVNPEEIRFPALALVISGGHTTLYLLQSHSDHQILGQTRDDAVGEAFDKAAKILGLSYPGGPSIAKAAAKAASPTPLLPTPKLDNPYDFSFSGLKTAFLRRAQELAGGDFRMSSLDVAKLLSPEQKDQLASLFQESAIAILLNVLQKADQEFRPEQIIIAGGVAANQRLRDQAEQLFTGKLLLPEPSLSTDNAVMIARAALYADLPPTNPRDLSITPN
ncbi:tRNA (adenosine(37)-N6)-threonylcarbamoyltransferase complex transferase subunit TsaD [Candidatus Saccharibacteria bacterium]|nr:tRNA (adenosine(37)-N6)-threonylcarbamoyltransferase complex transferase subunit TsaD [Candidatus Saccharibacteria bacterium]